MKPENEAKSKKYAALLVWSNYYNGFVATVSDLPGCEAFGRSRPEAADEVGRAIKIWIENPEIVDRKQNW